MKKIVLYSLIFFAAVTSVYAQQDVGAKEILNKMSKKYTSYQSITAQFSLKITQGKQSQTQNGNLWLKGKQYKIVLPEQHILSDGKNVWAYNKDNQEVELTLAQSGKPDSFDPSTIFTFYNKGYKYVQEPDVRKNNVVYQIIDLTPTTVSNYFKVRLTIQKSNTSLSSVEVFSKDASRFLYTLSNVKPNLAIAAQNFVFDKSKFPGVEVVDLR